MKPLLEVVGNLQTAEHAAEASVQAERGRAEAELDAAQKNILAGTETTGSDLHDGLIVLYGKRLVTGSQIITNYERVASELQGHEGEPIILIHSRTQSEGCTGFGGRGQQTVKTVVTLGLLEGVDLRFDYAEQSCALPTSTYAQTGSEYGQPPETSSGNLVVSRPGRFLIRDFDLGTDLDRKLESDDPEGGFSFDIFDIGSRDVLTIIIGRDAIAEWVVSGNRRIGSHRLQSLCEALSIEPLVPVLEL